MQSYEKKYTVAIVIVKILHLIFCSFFTHQEDEKKKVDDDYCVWRKKKQLKKIRKFDILITCSVK